MPSSAWDRSQVREWIGDREEELARFAGHELRAARLIALVETAQRTRFVDDGTASKLLDDMYALVDLVRIGRRNTGLLRNPTPELEILFRTMETAR